MDLIGKNLSSMLSNNFSLFYIYQELHDYLNKIKIDFSFYRIEDKTYYRNLLYQDDILEIYLIVWAKDSLAEFHYHPKGGCMMKILQGKLHEDLKLLENNQIYSKIYTTGEFSYIDNSIGSHQVKALENTYSLHFYSKK